MVDDSSLCRPFAFPVLAPATAPLPGRERVGGKNEAAGAAVAAVVAVE